MTVDIVLPHELAEKVFGPYLSGVKEREDLSTFTNFSTFTDEVTQALLRLPVEDQRTVHASLKAALA